MKLKYVKAAFIINILIILLSLCVFSYFDHNRLYPTMGYFKANPQKYDGVVNVYFGHISNQTNNYFYLNSGSDNIKILYNNPNKIRPKKFGYYSVKGVLKKEGYMELIDIHIHDYDYIKYVLSFFGFIFFVYILLKEWRITKKGFVDKNA